MGSTAVRADQRPPTSSKRGRYAKSEETRERILAAALEVAGRVGLHRASVAAIAERAGVAVGNLHYHFGSRDELLRELMRWLVGQLLAEVRGVIERGGSCFDVEEAVLRTYLAYVRRNPASVRLAEEVRLHDPELYRETLVLWLELFREAIREASQRGEIRPLEEAEIVALSYLLLGTRYFLDQMLAGVDGREYPGDDAVVSAYMKLIRHGLENRSQREAS